MREKEKETVFVALDPAVVETISSLGFMGVKAKSMAGR